MNKRKDQLETAALQEFKDPVIKRLEELRDARQLSAVCRDKLSNLAVPRLTEIINGNRPLTGYYLGLLLQGEVITMDHILQGRTISEMPEDLQPLLRRLSLSADLVDLCFKLKDSGVTEDQIRSQLTLLLSLR